MLKFIGTGSAFNTKLGNTSAFIRKQRAILLIDCGGTVFQRLQELDLLKDLDKINIIITHTHPDHVGSLGDIIFYAFYILHIKPVIIFPERELLKNLLEGLGVTSTMYEFKSDPELSPDQFSFAGAAVKFVRVPHVDTIPAYGFILTLDGKSIYYSGDSSIVNGELITMLSNGALDMIYQDTSGLDFEGNVHLSLRKLAESVPPELRSRVYCIHHDQYLDKEQVLGYGFNLVANYVP